MKANTPRPAASPTTSYLAFAAFGSLWGTWGAALPQIRDQAGLSDGQLGTALLFVALGALPAMLVTGRAIDRIGHHVPASALLALAAAGLGVSQTARGPVSLSAGLTMLGAASGAADIAINAVAGATERACGRPVITRSHASFSAGVVVFSLLTGLVRQAHAPLAPAFGLVIAVALVAAVRLTASPIGDGRSGALPAPPSPARAVPPGQSPLPRRMLISAGLVGALALAVENAHQSWDAVYLGSVLGLPPVLASAGPAVFAAIAGIVRVAAGRFSHLAPTTLLAAGGTAATAGTLILATSSHLAVALVGVACAAAGTAVLFPTLLRLGTATIAQADRGRATSTLSTTAYLGFLLGPVYVGHLADDLGLRAAMIGVAVLATVFTVTTTILRRGS